jgi:hypothetical protein
LEGDALTLVVPAVGAPNDPDKNHMFQVQTFLDTERNNWIFLSETGSVAVVPKTKARLRRPEPTYPVNSLGPNKQGRLPVHFGCARSGSGLGGCRVTCVP